uniref:Prostacyclin synthase n=1 Tax=Astatotilapia calliptera TaxID=8154 RepID=A0AAX7UVL6_ASTCA
MIWTILLLVLLIFILTNRWRCKGEPPLDKGAIPWLGHALEFGKDASKFINRMKMKHGDVFTVRVAGRYVTMLLDPHSYDTVLGDSDSLDFTRYAQVLMDRIFRLRLPYSQQAKSNEIMKRHFVGMNLATLNSAMSRNLRALMKAKTTQNQKDWKEEGLFNFSYSLLFRYEKASSTHTRAVMLLTMSKEECQKLPTKQFTHRSILWSSVSGLTDDSGSSPWLHAYRQFLQEDGTDAEMQNRAILMQLWATQGNVGPAAFWLLGFLLTNPEALMAVKREFSQNTQMETTTGTPLMDSQVNTPVFDSALEEALRLTAGPFITREVVREKTLCMADGRRYLLRKGDRVCLFPYVSPQMDPEIYHEPQKYKYDRFLREDGSVKKDFYKGGKRLKYYTMPWGAGTNGCVGKQFAINTIRQFVYVVLTDYDLELCGPNAQMPEINTSRYGFGMLQPEGDLPVRYKPRNTH